MAGIKWQVNPRQLYDKRFKQGVIMMMSDVERKAMARAPVLWGALRDSARLKATRDGAEVTFGSTRVPYAYIRHEVNYKHPSTVQYLAKAAQEVANSDIGRYFK